MHGMQPNVSNEGGVPPIEFTSCEMLDAAHENARRAAAAAVRRVRVSRARLQRAAKSASADAA